MPSQEECRIHQNPDLTESTSIMLQSKQSLSDFLGENY